MKESADIVVIGAGVIGLCTALQLARRGAGKVVVLEKGAGPGEGSTGASSAVCRFKYTRPEMVQLAVDGIRAYRHWPEFVGLAAPVGRFHNHGVLWLSDNGSGSQEEEARRLAELGVRTAVLDDGELRDRFPALNPCVMPPDCETGQPHECMGGGQHLLELDAGYFDPVDALHDLIEGSRALGVEVRFRSPVAKVMVEGGRAVGVKLLSGEVISCDSVVTSAGPWCNELFRETGFDCGWPLRPTRIQAVHLDRPGDVIGPVPITVDPASGIYFRTQNLGQQLIVSSVREEDEREHIDNPDDFAKYADDIFIQQKIHALQHRLPGLQEVRNVRGYSGLYTINTRDVHPIVGTTGISGMYLANGFSGHGFKLAPAIGSIIAQLITGQRISFDCSVTPEFLAHTRSPIETPSRSALA